MDTKPAQGSQTRESEITPGGGREARPCKVTPRGQIFTIESGLRQQHSFSPFISFFSIIWDAYVVLLPPY